MNKGMLTVGIIFLAVVSLILINIITEYSTSSEVDYYLVKETSEAALADSLDARFLSLNGIPRMDKEKYVESFIRRFAENANLNRSYDINFYGLNEVPPKVSVKVDSNTTVNFTNDQRGHMSTSINQMAETSVTENCFLEKQFAVDSKSDIGSPMKFVKINKYNAIVAKK